MILLGESDWSVSPAERPLAAWPAERLRHALAAACAGAHGACGAHCIHELWMRDTLGFDVDAALERLWRCAPGAIPEWLPMTYVEWLPLAYECALKCRAQARGRHHLYLVLLDYHDRRGGPHGVYVGMSHYGPAQRFEQHKAGIRASGAVLKRGLEVLFGPTLHLQRISRAEAVRLEAQLARALEDAGLLVAGGH